MIRKLLCAAVLSGAAGSAMPQDQTLGLHDVNGVTGWFNFEPQALQSMFPNAHLRLGTYPGQATGIVDTTEWWDGGELVFRF